MSLPLAERIAALENILDIGAKEVDNPDGLRVLYDLAEVRKRLADLKRQQAGGSRITSSIDLSCF